MWLVRGYHGTKLPLPPRHAVFTSVYIIIIIRRRGDHRRRVGEETRVTSRSIQGDDNIDNYGGFRRSCIYIILYIKIIIIVIF